LLAMRLGVINGNFDNTLANSTDFSKPIVLFPMKMPGPSIQHDRKPKGVRMNSKLSPKSLARLVAAFLMASAGANAADFTWDDNGVFPLADGPGNWNPAGGTNWFAGGTFGAWGNTSNDVAFFGVLNGAAGTINVGSVNANGITFNAPGSGTYTLAGGTITLGGATPTIRTNAYGVISSSIAGSNGLTKAGGAAEALYFDGNNTYSGVTNLNTGYLVARHANALGSAADGTIVASGATLQFENNVAIAGEGVTITGTGVGGNRGALASWSGNNSWGGSVTVAGNSTLLVQSGSLAVNGIIGGGATNLTKFGGGTLTIGGTASNTHSGTTIIDNGTTILAKTGGANAIVGTVQMGGGNGNQPNLRMSASGQFGTGVVMNFANASGNWARLDLQGTTQTLAGLNAGTIATQAGAVIQNERFGGGGTTADATLILNGSGAYVYNGFLRNEDDGGNTYKLSLVKEGTGTQTLAGNQITFTGGTTVNNGTLALRDTTGLHQRHGGQQSVASLDVGRLVTGFGNRSAIMGNAVSGSGTIDINNGGAGLAGGWTIISGGTSSLNFSGTININSGVFSRDNTNVTSINGTATVNVASGAFFGAGRGGNSTIGALNGSGVVSTLWSGVNAGSITLGNGGGSGTFNGVISGNGSNGTDGTQEGGILSLTKTGTGTQTLTGTNTYSGTTTISQGTLKIDGTGSLGSGTYAAAITNNGTFQYSSSTNQTLSGAMTGTGALIKDTSTSVLSLTNGGTNYTGTTTVDTGELLLFNATNYRSPTTVNSGAILSWGGNNNMQNNQTAATIALNNGGTLRNTNPDHWTVINGAVTNSGTTNINITSNATGASGRGFFLDGGLKGTGTVTINPTNAGSGVNFRNNNSTFSGRLIVNGIASTTPFAGSGIGVGGNTTGLQNADITLNGTMELLNQGIGWANTASGDFSMGALDGAGVMIGNFSATGGQTRVRIGNTNTNGSFSGTIANGTGNVIVMTKLGTGTQTFSGSNIIYTGSTTISSGILSLQMAGSGQNFNSNIAIASGATLDLTTANAGVDNWRFDTAITGPVGSTITKNGTGWVKVQNGGGLGGFHGNLIINDGTFGNGFNFVGDWTGSTADVVINSPGVLDLRTDNITIDTLSGNGTVANTYLLDAVNILTIGTGNGTATFNGVIRGAGGGANNTSQDAGRIALVKTGTGTQTLTGANTYSNGTTISGGTLLINNTSGSGTGSGAVLVQNGGTLGGTGTITTTGLTVQSGGTLAPGNSPGNLTVNGPVVLSAGSLFGVEVNVGGVTSVGNGTNGTDLLTVNGTIDLTGALLTGTYGGGLNNLFQGNLSADNMTWIVNNDDPNQGPLDLITGTFANTTPSPGLTGLFGTPAYFGSVGGQPVAVFYNSQFGQTNAGGLSGGNDLLLIAIPEPSRALLALLALVPLVMRRRK
jgi:autotransporter-associated beta strand protein